MIWTPDLNALHIELAELYPRRVDITRLARQANIRTGFISWQDQAMNDWFNVLEEADKQKKLRSFLEFIKTEGLVSTLIDKVLQGLNSDSSQIPPPDLPASNLVEVQEKPEFFISNIKELANADKLEDAVRLLQSFVASISDDLENSTINFSARLTSLRKNKNDGTITEDFYQRSRNQIRVAVLEFTDDLPEKIRLQELIGKPVFGRAHPETHPASKIYLTPPQGVEEKIIGNKNEMLPTLWLHKAVLAAKSVCRVLVGGRADGSGFLLKDGYVMTNSHVLPTKSSIDKAEIEFNYEEGQAGKSVRYQLDSSDVRRSSESLLDYCVVKVKDNPNSLLQQWGYLELETQVEVRVGDVANIIQHPWGGVRQIAFRDNKVISVWGEKIFYTADSDHGSSGSPVFNDDWKVIALHSRGLNEDDGGMQINEQGDIQPANQGFSIEAIWKDINQPPST